VSKKWNNHGWTHPLETGRQKFDKKPVNGQRLAENGGIVIEIVGSVLGSQKEKADGKKSGPVD
jgi:hypothetical protein